MQVRVRWQEVIERTAIVDVEITETGDVDRDALLEDLINMPLGDALTRDVVDFLLVDWEADVDAAVQQSLFPLAATG